MCARVCVGGERHVYRVLVGKRLFVRSRCRWKDNIDMIYKKQSRRAGTGFIRLRIGRSDKLL